MNKKLNLFAEAKLRKTLLVGFLIFCFTFTLMQGQEAEKKPADDPMANFSLVEKVQPAPENVKIGLESITAKDAVEYLKFISSDLLNGRDTATPGYAIAAHFAAAMFAKWGLKPAGDFPQAPSGRSFMAPPQPQKKKERSYFQNIAFKEVVKSESVAKIEWQQGSQKKSRTFFPEKDYTYYSSTTQSLSAPVVFVGYGIQEKSLKLDEYKDLNVKGKIVMMLSRTPGGDNPESPFNKGKLKEKYNPPRRMRRSASPKLKLAEELGAVAVLTVESLPEKNPGIAARSLASRKINDERPLIPGSRRRLLMVGGGTQRSPWDSLPSLNISQDMANAILSYAGKDIKTLKTTIDKNMQSRSFALKGSNFTVASKVETKLVGCYNVLGYLEGSDPELKNEVIVIGAHLDHLGRRGDYIYNGADDNGSGSVGVMEIAEAFAANPVKPKRSILFALWTGEEKGLYGSRYYVANPFFPLDKTAANLNLDMISRQWSQERLTMMSRMMRMKIPKDILKKVDIKSFISTSFDAHTPILKDMMISNNQYVGLSLHLSGSETASGGSDHAPFAQAKLPWIAFMAAMTSDYHQPSDSVDKISPKLMEKIIRLTYLTAYSLADK